MPVLPNVFTTGNLSFGLLSILTSIEIASAMGAGTASEAWVFRRFWWAGAFIVISFFFDTLDGRLARFIKHESSFGLSYDSISDIVSFGVAPAVLIYVWTLMDKGKLGLMAVIVYVVCAALRLARFNVQSGIVGPTMREDVAHRHDASHRAIVETIDCDETGDSAHGLWLSSDRRDLYGTVATGACRSSHC